MPLVVLRCFVLYQSSGYFLRCPSLHVNLSPCCLSPNSPHQPGMNQNTHNRTNGLVGQDKPKTTKVPHVGNQSILNRGGSESNPKSPFLTLAKDFDVCPRDSSRNPTSFDIPEHDYPSELSSDRGDQQKYSGYSQLERPWANGRHGQVAHTGRILDLNCNPNDMPLSRWRSEKPIKEPYHAIGGVANNQIIRQGQDFDNIESTLGPASSEAGTWGSSGERRG